MQGLDDANQLKLKLRHFLEGTFYFTTKINLDLELTQSGK